MPALFPLLGRSKVHDSMKHHVGQLWSRRRNTCLGVWVLLRWFIQKKKFSSNWARKISNYYFYPGSNWIYVVLVLGRNRSRFIWQEMPVLFPTPCQSQIFIHTYTQVPNHFLDFREKKNSFAEMSVFYTFLLSNFFLICSNHNSQ